MHPDATAIAMHVSRPRRLGLSDGLRTAFLERDHLVRVRSWGADQPVRVAVNVEVLSAVPKLPPRSTTTSTCQEIASGSDASSCCAV